uniref:Uncharacterized protein n=1 Tax=Arundo donax TaxID=35708 RepID=A0A0A9AN74_ARUDO
MQLLKREAFAWSTATDEAFLALKSALTQGPVLQLPTSIAPSSSTVMHPGQVLARSSTKTPALSPSTAVPSRRSTASSPLMSVSSSASFVGTAVRRAHGSLRAQVSPRPAPLHHTVAYMGKQAIWL